MKEILLKDFRDKYKQVAEDYIFEEYTIPKGFATDGASVPKCLQLLYKPFGEKYSTPAVIHDYMYYKRIGKRKADKIFKRNCLANGVSKFTTYGFYFCLKVFGRFYY
jgi:hypothetical protein